MASPAVVDHVMKHVFRIALKKSERTPPTQKDATPSQERFYVGQFYTRITGIASTEDVTIDCDAIGDVARAAVFACILHNRSPLIMLNDAFARCAHATAQVEAGRNPFELPDLAQDGRLSPTVRADLIQLLADMNQLIVANSSLLIVCPMFFNLEDLVARQDLKKEPLNINERSVRCSMLTEIVLAGKNAGYVQQVLTEMWQNDEKATIDETYSMFSHLRSNIVLRPIGVKPLAELAALTNIVGSKVGAMLFVRWLGENDSANSGWRLSGVKREVTTLFGRLLSSAPLTEEILEAAKMMNASASVYETAENVRKLRFYGKKDVASLRSALLNLREDHGLYVDHLAKLFKAILRTDFNTRKDLLELLGQLVSCNVTKRNMSRMTQIDQPPISLDDTFRRRRLFMPDITFGTSLNIMWVMLILAGGITEQKIESIDPNFCQLSFYVKSRIKNAPDADPKEDQYTVNELESMAQVLDNMLGFLSSSNAGMGDEKQLIAALDEQQFDVMETYNAKFITQIFWATLQGLGMLYLPSLHEFLKLTLFTMQLASTSPDPMNDGQVLELFSHVFTWRCVVQNGKFLEALWHYINICLQFFLRCALLYNLHKVSPPPNVKREGSAFYVYLVNQYAAGKLDDSHGVPSQFTVLPVEFIEIVLDVIKQLTVMRYYVDHIKPEDSDVLQHMDFELVLASCIYIMKAPQAVIKNLTLKCDTVSTIVLHLCKSVGVARFNLSHLAKQHLIDALTAVFNISQRADYNSRVSCRLNVIQALARLFDIAAFKKSFMSHIILNKDNFVQFMHLLLNDTTFIFEEVVTFLTEIRRRELAGITEEPQPREQPSEPSSSRSRNASRQGRGQPDAIEDDEPLDPSLQDGTIDANQLKSMSFSELQGRTRNLVEYGSEITTLLHILCREYPAEIVGLPVLLPQVACCLGCCLDNLAGENNTNLKVKNMSQYQFKPKEWLANITKCYLALYGGGDPAKTEPFVKAVVSEGRYFKPGNFERAFRIATREMLLNSRDRHAFFNMSQRFCQYAKTSSTLYQSAMEAEMPEEFLDPIMMDIMEDPVLLPTSGIVMDRKNIERHLMSEATDPFSRQPLTKSDLVPQDDLRRRIDAFLSSISQRRDSADDIFQS
ncbi:ubiquitin conjugation factor E4 B, putative [Babesia caballi]|uniref:RING-type E3 ubiquitin transferase n=1 Tax=Babesia caballi TaxID=5871 RepID=A0AAV4LRX4_BABCB|nr:ubiquitin conjugation factor E4 B, putative [Babesia caballi]